MQEKVSLFMKVPQHAPYQVCTHRQSSCDKMTSAWIMVRKGKILKRKLFKNEFMKLSGIYAHICTHYF